VSAVPESEIPAEIADLDFASVTPTEFATLVKRLSGKELAALMRGELRDRVLRAIFGRMERQFRPEAAGALDAVIRWEVTGAGDEPTVVWESAIADGTCAVTPGRSDARARVTFVLSDAEFLRLVSGNGNPVTMFLTRKIKISGDIALASSLTHLFDIPKA
jgi:predicted lipid carrier protein YhbT